jgi:amidohydrolase
MSSAQQSPTTDKQVARARVEDCAAALIELSHRIHAHPECAFEETHASRWCADMLADSGFDVALGICGLDTAFVASIGSGPLVLGICAEYDALPDIGHACGHNIIAAAAVGAARALGPLAEDLGITVRVLGTPAEEGGGGKIIMLERGGFDGLNASLMVHPWPDERVQMPCLAVKHYDVLYKGVEAHASAFPEKGVNAADALTVAQVGIGLLRQHAMPGNQVHGIITHGGDAPNIVPDHTSAQFYTRALDLEELEVWDKRVRHCFEAGALATGAALSFLDHGRTYSEFRADPAMVECYRRNAQALGRAFVPDDAKPMFASTDMANVSLVMPAIHPTLKIDSYPAVNHQRAFAAHCVSGSADKAICDGATAMAWTAIDLASDEKERSRLSSFTFHAS